MRSTIGTMIDGSLQDKGIQSLLIDSVDTII